MILLITKWRERILYVGKWLRMSRISRTPIYGEDVAVRVWVMYRERERKG